MSTSPTFVIVGAGLAGAKAAETLRAEGFDGRLLLLGDEAERPYDHPPLSKAYLRGETDRDSLYVHEESFYAAHGIELRTSTPVRWIDPVGHQLELASGEQISYERLLLATGATPRRLPLPGADLAGVQYLRTRSDADALAAAAARAEHVVVVGTGWIGSEAAASLRQLGRDVTLIGPDTAPLARVLGPEVGGVYRDLHADHGVRLALGTRVAGFRGHGRVEAVVTDDGRTVEGDLVLVGAGAAPRTELAEAAGLPVRNGLLVNEQLEAVGAAGVYAAGDVAAAWHPRYQSLPARRALGQRAQPGPGGGPQHARHPHPLCATALLLLRPVRPEHGVLRVRGHLGPGGGPGRPGRSPVHRLLAQGPAGRRRHERQRLGRHRAHPGPDPRRAAGRPRAAGGPRHPPGPGHRRPGRRCGTGPKPICSPASTTGERSDDMTKLQRLYHEQGQSPWLDNLTRVYLRDGTLGRLVADGIRGVTANPTIFAKAIEGSDAYDEQFAALIAQGRPVTDAYWDLVVDDIGDALGVLRPTFDSSAGGDGFVSIEVAPELARDTDATIAAARHLHQRIARPNLFVKIPATGEGVPAIQAMIAEGRSINITLIFSVARYAEVIDAYLAGLETLAEGGGDLASVHSVASFFVSRVDTEVDRRLDAIGTGDALALKGQAAVAQAKLAYRLFGDRFAGQRWERLAARGAQVQRPLWASTSTKNPSYPDTLYVDSLIGPDTVNTLPETTITAFEDHGTIARTIDSGVDHAGAVMDRLAEVGVDMDDVGRTLEDQGVASFHQSFAHVLQALEGKARQLAPR